MEKKITLKQLILFLIAWIFGQILVQSLFLHDWEAGIAMCIGAIFSTGTLFLVAEKNE